MYFSPLFTWKYYITKKYYHSLKGFLILKKRKIFYRIFYFNSKKIDLPFLPKKLDIFCFASKHQAFIAWVAKVMFRRRQLMIWTSKMMFFFAFFTIFDQFWFLNHQLSPSKHHFCDSCNERLMFWHETKNVQYFG